MTVDIERTGDILIVAINRPERRNAVDPETAAALHGAFLDFEASEARVAVLTGRGGAFCAGFDLTRAASDVGEAWFERHAINSPDDVNGQNPGPMGPTRLRLTKPVIAAVEGPAVAGGMELALWCDLRVVAESGFFGVYCRRWGVPLIDGGAIRLPRIVGQGRALDLILTGRKVDAEEALAIGLADRCVADGAALSAALSLAEDIARFPQQCMRADRALALDQWELPAAAALAQEWAAGEPAFRNEGAAGAARFSGGKGRGGSFSDI